MPHLYSQTLQKAGSVTHAVYGNFSGPKVQEIVLARGKCLSLIKPDNHGRVQSICNEECFGIIRCLSVFRLVGSNRDFIAVGSDSGRLVILEFNQETNSFVKVQQETFGKTGCRRIVPGQYLATDPSGRACMIAATEKQKFVYILNRDSSQKLTISSPLEAHKSHSIVFSLCALDVGYDNPLFASIEANYEDSIGTKQFTIYEMDLGINHVTRKYAESLPDSANQLIPVDASPGGCLVCCEDFIIYKKLGQPTSITCRYPRRADIPIDRGVFIISFAKHKLKDFNLILIQTEFGDIFRVDLIVSRPPNGPVEEIRLTYFDSIPPSSSMCITKTGFLFSASEFGNHHFYQFNTTPLLSPFPPSGPQDEGWEKVLTMSSSSKTENLSVIFIPKSTFSSLTLFDEIKSLSPIIDFKPIGSSLVAVCGRGNRSSLRSLRFGAGVIEMAATELPGKPSGVWTVASPDSEFDKYIVLSFVDVSLVLSIGEAIEEVTDSGILGNVPTLGICQMHDKSVVQIHPRGLRHVPTEGGNIMEWRAPRPITTCAFNSRQIVVGLAGGEIVYFELSLDTRMVTEIAKRDLGSFEVCSLSVSPVPLNRTRGLFMAVSLGDKSVRILSLEPDKLLKQVSAQFFPTTVESSGFIGSDSLVVGLSNGTLVRCCIDKVTGTLSNSRSRFLGVRPVRLDRLRSEQFFALSSKPWIVTADAILPLSLDTVIEYGASFNSPQCPDGFVTIAQNTLKIISCDVASDQKFSQETVPLSYTPRRVIVVPPIGDGESPRVGVLEADHNAFTEAERIKLVSELGGEEVGTVGSIGAGKGRWASCLRIVNPVGLETTFKIDFDPDECGLAMCIVRFYQLKDNRPCLIVASATDLVQRPRRSAKKSVLKTYLYDDSFIPQLVHVTGVTESESEGVPLALCPYEGRLLVSVSQGYPAGSHKPISLLRLYELGKKKLLKKTEYRNFVCGGFVSIEVINDRIFAADVSNSVHVLRLNRADGQIHVVCDDFVQRYMSAMLVLDYNTVIGADKFDNVFVLRVPTEVREEQSSTGESTLGSGGLRLGPDTAYILGKNNKFDLVCSFHVGETVTSLQKVVVSPGAAEVIMYSTLSGSVGALYPFNSKREYETFLALENQMRNEMHTSLIGRDHMQFRSFYLPVKAVVDGDLVSGFSKMKNREDIAKNVGKDVNEVLRLIEDIQNRIT